jgi:hypothetical protein
VYSTFTGGSDRLDASQNYTVFVAGTPAGLKPSGPVTEFLRLLKDPLAVRVIRAKGISVE